MTASKFSVTKEIEFDAGHRVPDHKSKCRNPHGHRYCVSVTCRGDLQTEGSSNGMVLDFGDIKEALVKQVHDRFDHGFIVYHNDAPMLHAFRGGIQSLDWKIVIVDFVPTAENLAKHIYELLDDYELIGLAWVDVYETPTSMARYPG